MLMLFIGGFILLCIWDNYKTNSNIKRSDEMDGTCKSDNWHKNRGG